ncbi:peroxisome proliferator-activated receptor alpha-like isoform X2 [Centruroides sculpturatus]|uniref:peroxisome proliferator-activated receptor alpha-like isoform X2 n=1 Tax=Centruroides sculpturatus TaxID=218467 RepID=UPI000C6DAD1B|nr:peroxisome proliferator-activated receptor alpha-like isoform X2 [Centruroides sculpturatus]
MIMATIEQITEQKGQRGKMIISQCRICYRQAWNDYYGCEACKRCLQFVFRTIAYRSCYRCSKSGVCKSVYKCKFCTLQTCYKKGLKPIRFGIHSRGYYLKDREILLYKVQTREPNKYSLLKEIMKFKDFLISRLNYVSVSLIENKPTTASNRMDVYPMKAIILQIVQESLVAHDVIKLENYYHDPYKCEIAQFQYLTMKILKVIRMMRDRFSDGKIDYETKIHLIYFEGPGKERVVHHERLHKHLDNIAFWMNVWFKYLEDIS